MGTIAPRYVEIDPGTGLLTDDSLKRIKRAVANAFRGALGQEALFMFAIEQQDKTGAPIQPHVHALAIVPHAPGIISKLKGRLHKVAGEEDPDTVKAQRIFRWRQLNNELALAEADFRRAAQYGVKNENSAVFRSKALLDHVHRRFEELKKHHKVCT